MTDGTQNIFEEDPFLVKLNSGGNFVWAENTYAAGFGAEIGSLTADHAGNLLLIGGPGVLQLSGAGSLLWADAVPGNPNDIVVDAADNIYLAGTFSGTDNFDPNGTFDLSTGSSTDVFVLKLGDSGNFLNAQQMGGPANTALGEDTGTGLAVGLDVYVVGEIHCFGNYSTGYSPATASFGPFTLTTIGNSDFFVARVQRGSDPTTTGINNVTVAADSPDTLINLDDAFFSSVYPVTALTFSATVTSSSNPNLFSSISVVGSNPANLDISYAAGQVGQADITVQATDPNNHFVTTTFEVFVYGADIVVTQVDVPQATAFWNGTVAVDYTIENLGNLASGPFDIQVQVNNTATDTFHITSLAAHQVLTTTQLANLLPSRYLPTPNVQLELLVDPTGALAAQYALVDPAPVIADDTFNIIGIVESEPNDSEATANTIAALLWKSAPLRRTATSITTPLH